MLSVKCPRFNNAIKFSERLPLIYQFYGVCKMYHLEYLPNKTSMLISAGVLGSFLGILCRATLNMDIVSSITIAFILAMIIQQLINPFYSIAPVDDD